MVSKNIMREWEICCLAPFMQGLFHSKGAHRFPRYHIILPWLIPKIDKPTKAGWLTEPVAA